ncbi:hypothetical protein MTR_1g074910 [Medicago truncatula]|uniref:Uncharacterized protein n=1 Tax=Medicago truncatula TaxID=3880 RepID=G7I3V3_MEDTR|nr:hypothetical protein MTR_1g074910 [Medicago truncatula]
MPYDFDKDVVFNPLVFYFWLNMDDPSNSSHDKTIVLKLMVGEGFDQIIVSEVFLTTVIWPRVPRIPLMWCLLVILVNNTSWF